MSPSLFPRLPPSSSWCSCPIRDDFHRWLYSTTYSILLACYIPGLQLSEFSTLRRLCKIISFSSGSPLSHIYDTIIKRHFDSCKALAIRILNDPKHPLHPELILSKSLRPLRRQYRLVPSRTTAFRNSVIPYLSRFLVSPDIVRNELQSNLWM